MEEKVIEKLRKLLAHKESAEKIGSMAEAEAFAARITSLLSQYKLEMSDINLTEEQKKNEEQIEKEFLDLEKEFGIEHTKRRDPLMSQLAHIVAKSNFCVVVTSLTSNRFYLVGKPTDKQITMYIFNTLYRASREMAELLYRKGYYIAKKAGLEHEMKGFKKSFLSGFNEAIYERLKKQQQEFTHEQGIILANENNKVALWMKENFKTSKGSSSINANNSMARNQGYQYGKSVAMRAGVSAGTASGVKRLN